MNRMLTWGLLAMVAAWWLYAAAWPDWLFTRLDDLLREVARWQTLLVITLPKGFLLAGLCS